MPDLLRKLAVLGLSRHFQALSANVERPAMIRTTNTASLISPYPAMFHDADSAAREDRACRLHLGTAPASSPRTFTACGMSCRSPVAPTTSPAFAQPFAGRCSCPDMRNIAQRNLFTLFSSSCFHTQAPCRQIIQTVKKISPARCAMIGERRHTSIVRRSEGRSATKQVSLYDPSEPISNHTLSNVAKRSGAWPRSAPPPDRENSF